MCEEEFLASLKEYLVRLLDPMIRDLAAGELFVEKTPHHAVCMAEIRRFLPESRIIHVLRDARDVVVSLISASRSWGTGWAPRTAAVAAAMWVEHVSAVRREAAALDARQFLEIRYEELWRSPAAALSGIASFLDLDWDEAGIAAAVEANSVEAARAGTQTAIALRGEAAAHGASVVVEPPEFVRRGSPGGWQGDLTMLAKMRVWWSAGDLMRQVGYPWDPRARLQARGVAGARSVRRARGMT